MTATATPLTFTVRDSDGSTANGTLTVTFDDDAPTAQLAVLPGGFVHPALSVDETAGNQADPEDTVADRVSSANFSGYFVTGAANVAFGADGAGSVTYGLSLNVANGVASGLFAVEEDADGGKGGAILLYNNNGVIEGRVGSVVYFTVAADAATGVVTLTQATLDGATPISIWRSRLT